MLSLASPILRKGHMTNNQYHKFTDDEAYFDAIYDKMFESWLKHAEHVRDARNRRATQD